MIAKVLCSAFMIIAASSAALAQASGPRIDLGLIVTDKSNKPLSTCGLVFFPKGEKELINAADSIAAALGAQFRLAYQSSKEFTQPEFRNVEVKLTSTDTEKRKAFMPSGYYVDKKDVNQKPTEPKSP